jgi:hypothetical protein
MDALWSSVRAAAAKAGAAAGVEAAKAKLRTDLVFLERGREGRVAAFGAELYGYVTEQQFNRRQDFYTADDDSNRLLFTMREPLIRADREISALQIRRGKVKEEINRQDARRKASIAPASTWGETVLNAGKSTVFAAGEGKLKTDLHAINTQIEAHKHEFGREMFGIYVKLEDEEEWLPTNRDIRSMYDKCRQDVEKLEQKHRSKQEEIRKLGGFGGDGDDSQAVGSYNHQDVAVAQQQQDSQQRSIAAVERKRQAASYAAASQKGAAGAGASQSSSSYGATSSPAQSSAGLRSQPYPSPHQQQQPAPIQATTTPASQSAFPTVSLGAPAYTTTQQQPPYYVDPFAPTTDSVSAAPPSFQQQQHPADGDPFAAASPAPASSWSDVFAGAAAGDGGGGSAAQQPHRGAAAAAADPFAPPPSAATRSQPPPPQQFDAFAPMGGSVGQGIGQQQQQQFSAFGGSAQQQQQQKSQRDSHYDDPFAGL